MYNTFDVFGTIFRRIVNVIALAPRYPTATRRACPARHDTNQEDPLSHHRSMTLLALSLSLVLAACKPAATPPTDPAATAPTPAAAAAPASAAGANVGDATGPAQAACPHPEFDAFLPHFGNEIALQEKSVADPLLSERIDPSAEPEPRLVSEKIALRDVTWPVMPDPAALPRDGREMVVSRQDDGSMKVLIRRPDTSDQQAYYFAQRPCWQLVRMVDESI